MQMSSGHLQPPVQKLVATKMYSGPVIRTNKKREAIASLSVCQKSLNYKIVGGDAHIAPQENPPYL